MKGKENLLVHRKEVRYVIRRLSLLGANISLKGKKFCLSIERKLDI